MVAILKATLSDNVFETIYDIIDNGVTDPNPPSTGTRKYIFSSYPETVIDKVAGVVGTVKGVSYPLVVIDAPTVEWEKLTICKNWVNLEIDISVFATSRSQSVTLMDSVVEALETSRHSDLLPLKIVFLNLISQNSEVEFRDEIKLHRRNSTFRMRFSFERTL